METTGRTIILSGAMFTAVEEHLRSCMPMEGCGVLAGKNGVVERFVPLGNADLSPVDGFTFEPDEHTRAYDHIERAGEQVLAIVHSHPHSRALMSKVDIRNARMTARWDVIAGRALWLIYDLSSPYMTDVRGWEVHAGTGVVSEVRVVVQNEDGTTDETTELMEKF